MEQSMLPTFGDISEIRDETIQNDNYSEKTKTNYHLEDERTELGKVNESENIKESMDQESEEIVVEVNTNSEPMSMAEEMELMSEIGIPEDSENEDELELQDLRVQEAEDGIQEKNAQNFEETDVDEDEVMEKENAEENEQNVENLNEVDENDTIDNEKLVRLPISRIKKIMKTDEEVGLINRDALFATTILTEHFITMIAQQSYKLAAASKKKTVNLNHVKSALTSSELFDFLEGTIPQLDS